MSVVSKTKERIENLSPLLRRVLLAFALASFLCCFGLKSTLVLFLSQMGLDTQFRIYDIQALLQLILLLGFGSGIILRKKLVMYVMDSTLMYTGSCFFGIAGNVLYAMYAHGGGFALFVAAMIGLSFFLVPILFYLGYRLYLLSIKEIGQVLGLCGCFFAVLQLASYALELLSAYAFMISAGLLLFFRPSFPEASNKASKEGVGAVNSEASVEKKAIEAREETAAVPAFSRGPEKKRFLIIFICGVIFYCFAMIFPNVASNPSVGSITLEENLFRAYISLMVMMALTVLITTRTVTHDIMIYGFILCSLVLLISFLIAVVFHYQGIGAYANGMIMANSSIFTFYLLYATLILGKVGIIEIKNSIGVFGILVLALPELVILKILKPLIYRNQWYLHIDYISMLSIVAVIVVVLVFAVVFADLLFLKSSNKEQDDEYVERLCAAALAEFGLSARESEVALFLYRGYSVKKIATAMNISTATVNSHMRSMYHRINIHSKQELLDLVNATIV